MATPTSARQRLSKIEIPIFASALNRRVDARGTNGSNPWLDGIFYEGQWGQAIAIAFGKEKPVYSYYFLKPSDTKLVASTPKLAAYAKQWTGSGGKQGIAGVSPVFAKSFRQAYQTIADATNLGFEQAATPEQANVWIANAYFANEGKSKSGPGVDLGMHEGFFDHRTWKLNATPLIQTLNAFESERESKQGALGPGTSSFATIVHEAGHGNGLSHPHDAGLGGIMKGVFPGLVDGDAFADFGTGLYGLTQTPFTMMSYKRGYTNPTINSREEFYKDNIATPMALDVAALQIKYGTNRTTRRGNTTYVLNPDRWVCIYDAGGDDWVKLQADAAAAPVRRDAYLNLRPAEMNAIRPHSGEPMEAYDFNLGARINLALNTLISAQTSSIGSPLGMGTAFAEKITRVLDHPLPKDTRELWLAQLTGIGDDLASLEASQVNPLQVLTAVKQYMNSSFFAMTKKVPLAEMRQFAPDFKALSDRELSVIRDTLALSDELLTFVNNHYPLTFKQPSGPQSQVADLARINALQQTLLERSSKGIAGYPSYLAGLNGGFTIAAGVLIENAEGGAGHDQIIGNAERNKLLGLDGNDVLEGYLGADTLSGGKGADVFVYANSADSPFAASARDTITDFAASDRISFKKLKEAIAKETSPISDVVDADFDLRYVGSQPFAKRPGEIRFAQGLLSLDLNGDGLPEMGINLPGVTVFQAANLIA